MALGIGHQNCDPNGHLALVREEICLPIAQDADYFTSASDGGAQGNFDVSAASSGTTVFLSTTAAKPLFYARRLRAVMTDNSGSDLRVSIRVNGKRWGFPQSETLSMTESGTAVFSTLMYDEVTSIKVVSITSPAASDVIAVGFDDSWLGLKQPISSRKDIKMVYKIANGTPDANGPKITSDITAAMVKVSTAGLDVKSLYSSSAIAVTDRYLIEYVSKGGAAQWMPQGKRLG